MVVTCGKPLQSSRTIFFGEGPAVFDQPSAKTLPADFGYGIQVVQYRHFGRDTGSEREIDCRECHRPSFMSQQKLAPAWIVSTEPGKEISIPLIRYVGYLVKLLVLANQGQNFLQVVLGYRFNRKWLHLVFSPGDFVNPEPGIEYISILPCRFLLLRIIARFIRVTTTGNPMPNWSHIAEQIHQATGKHFTASSYQSVGGGSINDAFILADHSQKYFVKLNQPKLVDMFAAEAAGLAEMASTKSVRVPQPICHGASDSHSFIVLEYLELANGDSSLALGQQLAAMHRTTREQFGWDRDNTIGSTEQINTWTADWIEFYGRHRLLFQLGLPGAQRFGRQLLSAGEELVDNLGVFYESYQPEPSLLHGDLWGGNYATARDGAPVIFDPAVYYGDREADIAMTELFGGFGRGFYDAYNAAWPLDPGYSVRRTLYNLYHVLNHLNLFGGGYGSQAYSMIGRLQSEYR